MEGPESHLDSKPGPAARRAARRMRWLTLGETIAVVAVVISAMTLWLNWSERHENVAEKSVERSQQASRAGTLILVAEPAGKGTRLDLRPSSADQIVQQQTIMFPAALGVDKVEITGEPRIEAGWFATALKRARDEAGLPEEPRGDERLPVLISTRFLVDGDAHDDVALYDVGYALKGQMLGGRAVLLRGLSLVRHKAGAAALDARWRALVPPAKPKP